MKLRIAGFSKIDCVLNVNNNEYMASIDYNNLPYETRDQITALLNIHLSNMTLNELSDFIKVNDSL